MRIIFFGTSEFATTVLESLHNNKDFKIIGIITQPDKPKGRGKNICMSAVKISAINLGYSNIIFQPEKFDNNIEFLEKIKLLNPDIGIVVSYGKLIPNDLIKIPKYELINIHSSLLPNYRGPSPIINSIMNSDKKTGVTIMKINDKLDTGDILLQKEIDIFSSDDNESLSVKLSNLGAKIVIEVLYKYKIENNCCSFVQDHKKATYTYKINKKDCLINWNLDSIKIFDFIRALCPNPSAYTYYKGKKLIIFKAEIFNTETNLENYKSGEIINIIKNIGFIVKTKTGCLLITEVQLENSKRMKAQAFICGQGAQKCIGIILGEI